MITFGRCGNLESNIVQIQLLSFAVMTASSFLVLAVLLRKFYSLDRVVNALV
jgi:hypothetical protein